MKESFFESFTTVEFENEHSTHLHGSDVKITLESKMLVLVLFKSARGTAIPW